MTETPGAAEGRNPTLLGDRYQLGEVIGRGGMAEVRRATDIKLGRPVAVKLLLGDGTDPAGRTRFIAEARMLARLSHTGLVTVFDAGFDTPTVDPRAPAAPDDPAAGQPFLVMELVEGPTLAQLMAEGPLPLADVGAIGAQVAEALAYVHDHGVVHRDVKPANVLRDTHQRVKLADFGIARLLDQTTRHTRAGHAVGTASYLAPEQVNGEEVDGAADIYSLGLVLLEAVTGRREYPGSAAEAALARLARPPEVPADLPPAWGELLGAMTQLDRASRPAALDVAATLRSFEQTGAAPVGVESVADAVVAPILSGDGAAGDRGATQPLTVPPGSASSLPAVAPAPPPAEPVTVGASPHPRTSSLDRVGDRLARGATGGWQRLRTMSSDAIGVTAAAVALVILLVVAGIASDSGSDPEIPDNTPAELREPLEELHLAVDGEDE